MLAFGGPRSTAASRRDDTARARKLRVIARKHDPGRLGYRTAVGCWWRRRPSYFSQTARRRPHLLPRHEVFRWTPLSVMLAFGFGLALTYNAAVPGAVTRRRGGREASLLTPLQRRPQSSPSSSPGSPTTRARHARSSRRTGQPSARSTTSAHRAAHGSRPRRAGSAAGRDCRGRPARRSCLLGFARRRRRMNSSLRGSW